MKFAVSIFVITLLCIVGYRATEWNAGYKETAMVIPGGEGSGVPHAFGTKGLVAGTKMSLASIPEKTAQDIIQLLQPFIVVILTFVLLGTSLFMVLSKRFDEPSKRWAFGTIGTIIGFWLK